MYGFSLKTSYRYLVFQNCQGVHCIRVATRSAALSERVRPTVVDVSNPGRISRLTDVAQLAGPYHSPTSSLNFNAHIAQRLSSGHVATFKKPML